MQGKTVLGVRDTEVKMEWEDSGKYWRRCRSKVGRGCWMESGGFVK
jgi:hypothetical protein